MLEIYDCTLREGEQADGASFNFLNRIELCKKLDEFGVDFPRKFNKNFLWILNKPNLLRCGKSQKFLIISRPFLV